jgi:hypothetical protein
MRVANPALHPHERVAVLAAPHQKRKNPPVAERGHPPKKRRRPGNRGRRSRYPTVLRRKIHQARYPDVGAIVVKIRLG